MVNIAAIVVYHVPPRPKPSLFDRRGCGIRKAWELILFQKVHPISVSIGMLVLDDILVVKINRPVQHAGIVVPFNDSKVLFNLYVIFLRIGKVRRGMHLDIRMVLPCSYVDALIIAPRLVSPVLTANRILERVVKQDPAQFLDCSFLYLTDTVAKNNGKFPHIILLFILSRFDKSPRGQL